MDGSSIKKELRIVIYLAKNKNNENKFKKISGLEVVR